MYLEGLAVIILILIYYWLTNSEKTCMLPKTLEENMKNQKSLYDTIDYTPLEDPVSEGKFMLTNKQQATKLSAEFEQGPSMAIVGNMQLSKAFTPMYERTRTDNLHLNLHVKHKKEYSFYPDNNLFSTKVRNMEVIIDRIDMDGFISFFKPKFADDKNDIIDYVDIVSYNPIVVLLYSNNNFVAGTYINNPNGFYRYMPNYSIYIGNYEKRNIKNVDYKNYEFKMIDKDIVEYKNKDPSKLVYSRYLP